MNFKYILNVLGKILLMVSIFMTTILPWIFHFHEHHVLFPVLISIAIPLFLGVLLINTTKSDASEIHAKEGYLLVTLTWLVIAIIGSLPYYISQTIPSFVDAFFESVSGFTTTGSSILTDIEALPKSILYWRSLTNWIGGMGIIVLVIAILPQMKMTAYQFFDMEASAVMNEKIRPRTPDIAKRLWMIYFLLTAVLVVLLMFGGVNFFESLCHAFGTIATGGFSTKNASIAGYSAYVQYVITLFMLLSGVNFTLHYFVLNGNLKRVLKNTELKTYLSIIFLVGFTIAFILFFSTNSTFEKAFRDAFFQVVSIITATGFSTVDYLQWKEIAWILLFALMFVGASVGSTGGGIKVIRHVLAFQYIRNHFRKLMHPNAVLPIRINGGIIMEEKVAPILSFIILYLVVFIFGSILMAAMGLDMESAFGSVITTMGGIGPGIGSVGPAGNFAHVPDLGKVLLSFLMIIGRLELYTFLIVFSPAYWKK